MAEMEWDSSRDMEKIPAFCVLIGLYGQREEIW